MPQLYSTFIRFETGVTAMILPGSVSEEEAKRQAAETIRHFVQFPGGTQSVAVWTEPTL